MVKMYKRSKYNAVKTVVDGITFASKKEAKVYCDLQMLKFVGEILNFSIQPKFPITIKGKIICTYIADFRVWYKDRVEVWDVKGVKTPIYRLKKKCVEAEYGIVIIEK
jgi:hypothetical protein